MAISNRHVCMDHRLLMRRIHLKQLGCRVLTDLQHVQTHAFVNAR
jgi:hypothetical protein